MNVFNLDILHFAFLNHHPHLDDVLGGLCVVVKCDFKWVNIIFEMDNGLCTTINELWQVWNVLVDFHQHMLWQFNADRSLYACKKLPTSIIVIDLTLNTSFCVKIMMYIDIIVLKYEYERIIKQCPKNSLFKS